MSDDDDFSDGEGSGRCGGRGGCCCSGPFCRKKNISRRVDEDQGDSIDVGGGIGNEDCCIRHDVLIKDLEDRINDF